MSADVASAPAWHLPPHGRHEVIDPPALHFGSSLVLLSSLDDRGRPLVRPISAWATVGNRIWIGFGGGGRTRSNLSRNGECVVNVAQADLAPALEAFQAAARLGRAGDGFRVMGLSPIPSTRVRTPRVRECYVQIECTLVEIHASSGTEGAFAELDVQRVHAVPDIVRSDSHHFDADSWQPLLYAFKRFFTLATVSGRPDPASRADDADPSGG